MAKMEKEVHILSEKKVLDGFFKVHEDVVRFEKFDGSMSEPVTRLTLERKPCVACIIFNTDTKKFILTRQYRHAIKEWCTEIVAGGVEDTEPTFGAALREIQEEVGYKPKLNNMSLLTMIYTSPGITSEGIIVLYVKVSDSDKESDSGGGLAEEQEDIETLEYAVDEIEEVMARGIIKDAKTIIALQWILLNKAMFM